MHEGIPWQSCSNNVCCDADNAHCMASPYINTITDHNGEKRLLITDLDPHVLLLWSFHYKECFDDKALFSSCISSKRAREEYRHIY